MRIATNRITAAWLLLVAVPFALAQERVPGEVWLRFESPEEAGFASVELADAMVSVAEDGALVIGHSGRDTFDLLPVGDDHFPIADLEQEVAFDRDVEGKIVGLLHFPDATGGREVLERTRISTPPNIVLVFIDDMGWADLSCFGNEKAETPKIDAMAAEGIAFEQSYVNAPICPPIRPRPTTSRRSAPR